MSSFFSSPSRAGLALVDQTAAASNYFSSMRTPATFMATQAVGTLLKVRNTDASDSPVESVLIEMNQFLVALAFMTAITSVVSGTAAGVKILHGGFDPMANTPYDFLVREFEFEYISTRWTFVASIFCFVIGMAVQSIVQFDLLEKPNRLLLFVSFVGAFTTYLMSYINNSIYDYGSIVGMTGHFAQLITTRIERLDPLVILFSVFGLFNVALLSFSIVNPIYSHFRSSSVKRKGSKYITEW